MNVYEAALKRIEYIFNEFDNVYVAFSGGKDSGVVLNLFIDEARRLNRTFKVLYVDLEGMYKETINFIERMLNNNKDVITYDWVCLPLTTTSAVSLCDPFWITWQPDKQDVWVRDIPNNTINLFNHSYEFYKLGMTIEKFMYQYAKYQSKNYGKTACIIGIRTQESLNRWRAIFRKDVTRYKNEQYSTFVAKNTYNFYPIFDWQTEDVWTYNGKFNKDYNRIYDLMYRAGVPLSKMRIAQPFGDEQKAGLQLFKVIEPETWEKIVNRVAGVNFGNIYCKTIATGSHKVVLPKGHTWKSYCEFLLNTLPEFTKKRYKKKFIQFIQHYKKHNVTTNMQYIPDTDIFNHNLENIYWRKMATTLIKNSFKDLNYSITQQQLEQRAVIINKYKDLL